MLASEIRTADEMYLGDRFVGHVTNTTPWGQNVLVEYLGEATREFRTIAIPVNQDVRPLGIPGYEDRNFLSSVHEECGRRDCDGGCCERLAEQFDRGQM